MRLSRRCDRCAAALDGAEPELAYLFVSPSHLAEVEIAAAVVREELGRPICSAAWPRASSAARASSRAGRGWRCGRDRCRARASRRSTSRPSRPSEGLAVTAFPELEEEPALVTMLVDPYTFPAGSFLRLLNEEHAGLPVVGGIAAGAGRAGRAGADRRRRATMRTASWAQRSRACPCARSSRRGARRSAATPS